MFFSTESHSFLPHLDNPITNFKRSLKNHLRFNKVKQQSGLYYYFGGILGLYS